MRAAIMLTIERWWKLWKNLDSFIYFHQTIDQLLVDYETVVEEAVNNGINVVTQDFTISWNYIQSVFFSTTILTTIGKNMDIPQLI